MKLNKDHYLSLFYIGLGVLILFFTSRITSLFTVATNDTGPKFFPKKLNVWHRILFAILMVALTYVLFSYVIKIPLPQGKWIKTLLKAVG